MIMDRDNTMFLLSNQRLLRSIIVKGLQFYFNNLKIL